MDKYQRAIKDYELRRQAILDFTQKISNASIIDYEKTGTDGYKCVKLGRDAEYSKNPETCVKIYWDARQENIVRSEEALEFGGKPELMDLPDMCEHCQKVDHLVQQRKEARKNFGIAKRTLSALGRKLIKG